MHTGNPYKERLVNYYYPLIKKQIEMDNKKVENSVKQQIDKVIIVFDFDGEKTSAGDAETVKMINKEVVIFKNKIREKLNVEMYLKRLY